MVFGINYIFVAVIIRDGGLDLTLYQMREIFPAKIIVRFGFYEKILYSSYGLHINCSYSL